MLKHSLSRLSIALLMLVVIQPAWSNDYAPKTSAPITTEAPATAIKNAKQPFPGILTGGQPSEAQLIEAKQKGYKTIITLRPTTETGNWDEQKIVQGLGMKFISIPVAGIAGVSIENSSALISALSDPADYPVMVHCASGNRVGALFALDAGLNQNLDTEQALEIGRSAGMTSLEEPVKNILD
ncbi:MAG: protein tyrosine phosphatase family protein [Pseudomonadales bacterium]|nr:protein tyrosine phosphatase family protein [Pseudomonadales bacterium]